MINTMKGDITGLDFDLIVNPANCELLPGAGVNREIFKKAGHGLVREVLALSPLKTGQAVLTDSYSLPCKGIIHAVGPVYNYNHDEEEELLACCYWNAMVLAFKYLRKNKMERLSLAFPSISTGNFGFPEDQACQIAVTTVQAMMKAYPDTQAIDVTFICQKQEAYELYKRELAR